MLNRNLRFTMGQNFGDSFKHYEEKTENEIRHQNKADISY